MNKNEQIFLKKGKTTKVFTKLSEVRAFLFVAIPRIKEAIAQKKEIDGWSISLKSYTNLDDTLEKKEMKEYILYNKLRDSSIKLKGLDAVALRIRKKVDYVQKLLDGKIEDEIYELDELFVG